MIRLALILALFVTPAAAQTLSGTASVTDGDTLEIHGERIRLHGIDAAESGQRCYRDGEPWRCGQKASLASSDKIGAKVLAHGRYVPFQMTEVAVPRALFNGILR